MKKLITFFAITALLSCSQSSKSKHELSLTQDGFLKTKILASNVAFAATGDDIDTEAKVLASNVVLDENLTANLQSSDVQSALEEIQPMLSSSIVGTWSVKTFNSSGDVGESAENLTDYTIDVGTATFNQNGTVAVSNISENNSHSLAQFFHADDEITSETLVREYQVTDDMVLSLRYYGNSISDAAFRGSIYTLLLTKSDQDKFVLSYSGVPYIFTRIE